MQLSVFMLTRRAAALAVMKYGFILRSIITAHTPDGDVIRARPTPGSGSMNFTNFMERVLLIVSTGFAPGSIYGSTLFVHDFFAVCASLDPVQSRSFWYKAF
jgi:hypothetical protein